MRESFEIYVRDGWINRDERFRGTDRLIQGGIVTDDDVVSAEEIRKSAYYQDFLARGNLKGYVAVRVGTGDHIWALTFHRTFQQDPFSHAELQSFRQLSVELGSTAEIATALGFARGEAALSAFDVAGKAALLLNRVGEVVRVNGLAEQLFDDDVKLVQRRLTSSDRNARDKFETSLRRLLWSLERSGVPPISFPRSGRSPVAVYLMRSFQLADTPLSSYHAIAVLIDPDARFIPALKTLQTTFNLTLAEARFAIALQSGADVQSEAIRLGLAPDTLRKHLKSIFAKTRLRRQADLVAMLSNFLPKM